MISKLIKELEEIALNPRESIIKTMKETGKRIIGCFPYYTPDELVYAADMIPVGMWGGQTEIVAADKYLQGFCCSLMRANMEFGIKGEYDFLSGIIIPPYCDSMKCILENWKVAVPQVKLIPIVYPQNRRIEAGTKYLVSELKRVQDELEKITGNKISEEKIRESIEIYKKYREVMRKFVELANDYPITLNSTTRHLIIKAGYFVDKKDYIEKVSVLIDLLKKTPMESEGVNKVVITGILAEPVAFLDLFKENNIAFAADDLAHESRQFRTTVTDKDDVYETMASRIANIEGCSLLYDDLKVRGKMIIDMVKDTKADGVVVCMLKFCDPEEFDYPILKKEFDDAGIPVLYIEIDQTMDSVEQLRTRVQSFSEMLDV